MKSKKVAVVHDWLRETGGAEVVLKYILKLFPEADLYTMIDTLPEDKRDFLKGHKVYSSLLQKYKITREKYTYFTPLMPYLVEQFDLSKYDLIISSSHFVAKGVITHPCQLHISYIYSPARYAWDLYYDYDRIGAFGKGLKRLFMKLWLHKLRVWDFVSGQRPDYLISDSLFIKKRVKKSWRRDSSVIYPPVEIDEAIFYSQKDDYYVTMSRLIEYKRVDLIIEAFNRLPNKKLIIIGDGRSRKKLEKLVKSENIIFKGYLSKEESMSVISKAKAFIFMPKEDFGIVPIEAQACGTPVIAYRDGGALETVLENETGVFVEKQDVESLLKSIELFEKSDISVHKCRKFAEKFSAEVFIKKFREFIKVCEERE